MLLLKSLKELNEGRSARMDSEKRNESRIAISVVSRTNEGKLNFLLYSSHKVEI